MEGEGPGCKRGVPYWRFDSSYLIGDISIITCRGTDSGYGAVGK